MTDKFAEFRNLFASAPVDGNSITPELIAKIQGINDIMDEANVAELAERDDHPGVTSNFRAFVQKLAEAENSKLADVIPQVQKEEEHYNGTRNILDTDSADTSTPLTDAVSRFKDVDSLLAALSGSKDVVGNPADLAADLDKIIAAETLAQNSADIDAVANPAVPEVTSIENIPQSNSTGPLKDDTAKTEDAGPIKHTPPAAQEEEDSGKVKTRNQPESAVKYMYYQFKAIFDDEESNTIEISKGGDKTLVYEASIKKFIDGKGEIHMYTYRDVTLEAFAASDMDASEFLSLRKYLGEIPGIRTTNKPEVPAAGSTEAIKVASNKTAAEDLDIEKELRANNGYLVESFTGAYRDLKMNRGTLEIPEYKSMVEELYNNLVDLKETIRRAIGNTLDLIDDLAMGTEARTASIAGDLKSVNDFLGRDIKGLKTDLETIYERFYSLKTKGSGDKELDRLESVVKNQILPSLKIAKEGAEKIRYSDMDTISRSNSRVASSMSYMTGLAAFQDEGQIPKAKDAIRSSYLGANLENPEAFNLGMARVLLSRTALRCATITSHLIKLEVSTNDITNAFNHPDVAKALADVTRNVKFDRQDVLKKKGLTGGKFFALFGDNWSKADCVDTLKSDGGMNMISASLPLLGTAIGPFVEKYKGNLNRLFNGVLAEMSEPFGKLSELMRGSNSEGEPNKKSITELNKQTPEAFLKVWAPMVRIFDAAAAGVTTKTGRLPRFFAGDYSPREDMVLFTRGVDLYIDQVGKFKTDGIEDVNDVGDLIKFIETHAYVVATDVDSGRVSLADSLDNRFAGSCVELATSICKGDLRIPTMGEVQDRIVEELKNSGPNGQRSYCLSNFEKVMKTVGPIISDIDAILADDEKGKDAVKILLESEENAQSAGGVIGNLLNCILAATVSGSLKHKGRDSFQIAKDHAKTLLYIVSGNASELAQALGESITLPTGDALSVASASSISDQFNQKLTGRVFFKGLDIGSVGSERLVSAWSYLSLKLFADYVESKKGAGDFQGFYMDKVIPNLYIKQADGEKMKFVDIVGTAKVEESTQNMMLKLGLGVLYGNFMRKLTTSSNILYGMAGSRNRNTSLKTWASFSMSMIGYIVGSQLATSVSATSHTKEAIRRSRASLISQLANAQSTYGADPELDAYLTSINAVAEGKEVEQVAPATPATPATPANSTNPVDPSNPPVTTGSVVDELAARADSEALSIEDLNKLRAEVIKGPGDALANDSKAKRKRVGAINKILKKALKGALLGGGKNVPDDGQTAKALAKFDEGIKSALGDSGINDDGNGLKAVHRVAKLFNSVDEYKFPDHWVDLHFAPNVKTDEGKKRAEDLMDLIK